MAQKRRSNELEVIERRKGRFSKKCAASERRRETAPPPSGPNAPMAAQMKEAEKPSKKAKQK
jgi:hypothetical protein